MVPTSKAYSFSGFGMSTGVAYFLICARAWMGLWAPPVLQPWQGHAVCWTALRRRRMALRDAAGGMVQGERRRLGERGRWYLYGPWVGMEASRKGGVKSDVHDQLVGPSPAHVQCRDGGATHVRTSGRNGSFFGRSSISRLGHGLAKARRPPAKRIYEQVPRPVAAAR